MSLLHRRAARVLLPLCMVVALVVPGSALAAAPSSSIQPFINGMTGNLGDVLTCSDVAWTGATSTSNYWKREGLRVAESGPYTVTLADLRRPVACVQVATNSDGTTESESFPYTFTEPAPTVVSNPTITGTAIVGRTLTCDGAMFSGLTLDPPTFEWSRQGGGVVGAGQTYRPVVGDVGWDLTCRAAVSNPSSSIDAYSRGVTVESGLPNVDTIPKVVGKAQPSFVVTCRPGTWEGEGITFTYQWLLRGKPIKGATTSTVTVVDAWDEQELKCRVTAINANGAVPFDSHVVAVFTPPIKAPLTKIQPKLPKLGVAIAKGVTAKLICNVTCATEATAMMLLTDAQRLGIASKRDKGIGGFFIVGQTYATRTYAGELLVTTQFTAKAKRGLAKAKSVRVDYVYMTSNGTKYSFNKYHVAASRSTMLRR